jgi:hypothetical protein
MYLDTQIYLSRTLDSHDWLGEVGAVPTYLRLTMFAKMKAKQTEAQVESLLYTPLSATSHF